MACYRCGADFKKEDRIAYFYDWSYGVNERCKLYHYEGCFSSEHPIKKFIEKRI